MSDGDRASDPSDAFDLVANETRFAIVRALWDRTDRPGETVSFATLRSEAGVRDSGQFNYHLDKLTPEFVRPVDDGYRLTEAGRRIVGAAVSGVYTDLDVSVDPRPAGDCPACEGTLELGYENGFMLVECGDCGKHLLDMSTPPILVAESDSEDLPAVLARHAMAETQRMNRGLCVYCGGPLETDCGLPDDSDSFEDLRVEFTCGACEKSFRWNVFVAVLDHPAVVGLLGDAGIDLREFPLWEAFTRLDVDGRIASEEPLRVDVTIGVDGQALTLTLDESLDVLECAEAATEAAD